jgi:hypothetical protein
MPSSLIRLYNPVTDIRRAGMLSGTVVLQKIFRPQLVAVKDAWLPQHPVQLGIFATLPVLPPDE